ncbi:hypothetical protein [Saccharothrix obliqua]|uniref:hypothetical protein n=1 Tax=Saccharothrix obliqua TaxID=2861747 RepID=UPI001C606C6F|nr:hypothetical protein [Saccharothrix obliqua]MBW4719737.1 hypothetical protein [Saccharothrix obliqua]
MSHPAVREAHDACAQLGLAARKIGQEDPAAAVLLIDYEPGAVDEYAARLEDALKRVDGAIAETEAARDEQGRASEGEAASAAQEATAEDLALLRAERDRLAGLIKEVRALASDMDRVVSDACAGIVAAVRDPEVGAAVALVLDDTPATDPAAIAAEGLAEDLVGATSLDVIKRCLAAQDQVEVLSGRLAGAVESLESSAGGATGTPEAQGGTPGAAEGGVAGSGAQEGGVAGSGEPAAGAGQQSR